MSKVIFDNYIFENKIIGTKNRLKDLVNQNVFQILEKYEKLTVMNLLDNVGKAKNLSSN